jgi:Ca-activated chloride channel homolog
MKLIKKLGYLALITTTLISCMYENTSNSMSDINLPANFDEKYKDYEENPFFSVTDMPVSTFSIDADGGSYSNMRRYLYLGQIPPKASVRIEEYINYFTFDYPEPVSEENVSLNSEISTCPWNSEHHLMRIGIKGKTISDNSLANSNYVFLIDVSGSMNSPEKLGILKSGFKLMVDGLKDNDKVAIVTYAGEAAVLLNSTNGDEKDKIKLAIDKLGAGGSTAGAAGISTAYEIAQKNFIPNGNNRVILGTDGDFNVGTSSTDDLIKLIEGKRETGIYLTVLGVGGGNLNDEMMEQVANKGNGNYEYIDNASQIQKVFVYEKSKFYTVAKDCKIQLTFNTNMIDSYRLIGYENRVLSNKDFKNDSTDAGELGSSQTVTALYEIKLKKNDASEQYANFDFRYKRPNEQQSRLINLKIQTKPTELNNATENMRFAVAVSGLGLLLKESKYKGNLTKQMILDISNNSLIFDPNGYRQEFVNLVKTLNK